MLDPKTLLGQVDTNGLVGKLLGGMATKNFAAGLLTGGVASTVLGRKDAVENLAKAGGLALLGTLAYKTWGTYQQQKSAGGNASIKGALNQSAQSMLGQAGGLLAGLLGENANPATTPTAAQVLPPAGSELPLAIIRAMIAAAKADGHMDTAESAKIIGQLEQAGLSTAEKTLLMQEMANTPTVQSIAAGVRAPQEAAEVYLAALLVCDSQCENEQRFLGTLAGGLNLEPAFTAALQKELLALPVARAGESR